MLGVLDDFDLNSEINDLGDLIKAKIPPELLYACHYWGAHLRVAELGHEGLEEALVTFTNFHLMEWMEVISYVKGISWALESVEDARTSAVC